MTVVIVKEYRLAPILIQIVYVTICYTYSVPLTCVYNIYIYMFDKIIDIIMKHLSMDVPELGFLLIQSHL